MKFIFQIIALLLVPVLTFSQAPAIEWEKCYGGSEYEKGYDIKPTSDGGYIFVGTASSADGDLINNDGSVVCWIVKLNNMGTIVWQRSVENSSFYDYSFKVLQITDGSYVVAGYIQNISGSHVDNDFLVIKLDANGDIEWQKNYGGYLDDRANSIQQTSDGGYILAGLANSSDGDITGNYAGSIDAWIVKLDAAGNISWQKSIGGTGEDHANCIRQTSDGGYIVAGASSSTDFDVPGGWSHLIPWIVKLDHNGNISWQKEYGSHSANNEDAYSIEQTTDGGYIVSAVCTANGADVTGNHGAKDFWIIKLDYSGNLQWQQSLGGPLDEWVPIVHQMPDGGYIIGGTTDSNGGQVTGNNGSHSYLVVKVSMSGMLQWQKTVGGHSNDDFANINLTPDGGFILTGASTSLNDSEVTGNHDGGDVWVVKLSSDPLPITLTYFNAVSEGKSVRCNWQTQQEQNSSYFEIERSDDGLHFNAIGRVAAAGSSALQRNYSFTDKDAFAAGMGNLYYRLKMVDADGKYDYSKIENIKIGSSYSISVYPNPVVDKLLINFNSARTGNAGLLITDYSGRKIYNQQLFLRQGNNSFPINVSRLADGMYILSVKGKEKYYGRFLKRGK